MDAILQEREKPNVLYIVGSCVAIYLSYLFILYPLVSSRARFWRSQQWVGVRGRLFSKMRANFDSITGTRSMLTKGYDSYSKNKQAFALPRFGSEGYVVVPAEKIQQISHLPESQLSFQKAGAESIAVEWTGDMDLEHNQFHFDIVRKQLTRKLPMLTTDVYSELVLGMQDQWPAKKGEWISVLGYETCIKIVSRAANRVFCGPELCRNEEFLDAIRNYTQGIFGGAFMINMLPRFLRPVIAPILTSPNKKPLKLAMKYAIPMINERLSKLKANNGVSPEDAPTDALQWLLEDALKQDDPAELQPEKLARRIIRLNMVAIHTTSLTVFGTLLDILSSPDAADTWAGLRDEAQSVYARHGEWNKVAVNELHRADSALKESMRYGGLGLIGMMRIVTAENGVDLGDGIHAPKGVTVVVPQRDIHHDSRFYDSPDQFDAFRFSRAREELTEARSTADDELATVIDAKSQAIITTSDRFLGFGHGKHACPGRFFASQEMKLMLAHAVVTYDMRLKGERIVRDISVQTMPDDKAQFEIRLRE